jgi:hypothetical protein
MKTSAHSKIGLENEDTRKLRNKVTLCSTGITVVENDGHYDRGRQSSRPSWDLNFFTLSCYFLLLFFAPNLKF